MKKAVPFNLAWVAPQTELHVRASLASGQTAGDGVFTKRCHRWLEDHYGCERAFLTPSCTAALELAALLLQLQPGDEVLVPSFTFVSTASAFALFGAKIVFADVARDTLTIDVEQLASLITPRTRAIVIVHYAGITPDPAPLIALCHARNVTLIEDNAHALGSSFNGHKLGTFGQMATLSFHESKNFSCGEGGALLVNDPVLAQRAEILREKGTNRSAHLRREIAKYHWVDLGSSYLASDITAAVLLAQLESYAWVQERRLALWNNYFQALQDWAAELQVQLPTVPEKCAHSAHLFYMVFPTHALREQAICWMKQHGVEAYFHYLPLHSSPQGARCSSMPVSSCPVTNDVSSRLMRLPLYPGLSDEDQKYVVDRLTSFLAPGRKVQPEKALLHQS